MKKTIMNDYDFLEGIEFVGLMPNLMKMTGSIGEGDNVKFLGVEARGVDPLEVPDIDAIMNQEG